MKRCKRCGRTGTIMLYVPRSSFSHPPRLDEWACHNVAACNERVRQLGKWIGTRVIRRRDFDGTKWTIRRWDDLGLRGLASGPWTSGWVLICEYRELRTTSWHPTVQLAQAHRDDVVRSWEARSLREYASGGRS